MWTAWAAPAAAVPRSQGYDEAGNHPGSESSMLNIGTPELLVILIIALLVVGPQRLPELSRQLGRGLREFRKIQDDVKDMVKVDLDTPDAPPPSAPAGSPMAPGVHRTRRPAAADGTGADGSGAGGNGAPRDGHAPAAG